MNFILNLFSTELFNYFVSIKWISTQLKRIFNLSSMDGVQVRRQTVNFTSNLAHNCVYFVFSMSTVRSSRSCDGRKQGAIGDREEVRIFKTFQITYSNENKYISRQFEDAIKNYDGPDPLAPWYEYICWIQQSYPSMSNESGLDEIVSRCIVHFEGDDRYYQDRRMVKLFIKYVS